jgi:hypothetical protein
VIFSQNIDAKVNDLGQRRCEAYCWYWLHACCRLAEALGVNDIKNIKAKVCCLLRVSCGARTPCF